MSDLSGLIQLARPHQHVKNIFVLLPLFFAGGFTDPSFFVPCLIAFVAFSFTASGVYVLNDLHDIEEDRIHPQKQKRPLASGRIQVSTAKGFCGVLFTVGLGLALFINLPTFLLILFYATLNIAYSMKLKQVSLLDVTLIAVGFVLRLFVGSVAGGIYLSHWIVVLTFLLALFLALAKRRDDLVIQERTGQKVRIAASGYSMEMLTLSIGLLGASVILVYLQYTTDPTITQRMGSEHLYLTTLFVILGILRYLQITLVYEQSGSPTRVLLTDTFTKVNLVLWFLTFGWILYLS